MSQPFQSTWIPFAMWVRFTEILRSHQKSPLHSIIHAISFLFLLTSCSSKVKDRIGGTTTDTPIILLPKATALPKNEQKQLYNACSLWYDSVLKNSNFNGGMLVAKNGSVVFEQYKGMERPGSSDTIDTNTPLHIASVSKTFTAMAVLQLAQKQKIELDDLLSKFFPEFNYPGVTIKSLLNHRSGLPNYLYFMEDLGWDKSVYITNEDVLKSLVSRKNEIKNINPADKKFNYCNTNYVLLALLIEKISGFSFPEYMRIHFFEPLRMRNTFVFTLKDTSRRSLSYDWRGKEIPINFLDEAYGDKNIYTTPRDLLIWDRALASDVIFNKHMLDFAYTPYSNEKPGIKNYGLGWRMNVYPTGKKLIFHNGWWHGSNAVFVRLIEEDATIIVIGNRYTNAVYKAMHLCNIFNHYFDVDDYEEKTPPGDTTVSNP
ncbi:MAG: serine hydrolase domain-containing protein [Ferruginibacter sp.]